MPSASIPRPLSKSLEHPSKAWMVLVPIFTLFGSPVRHQLVELRWTVSAWQNLGGRRHAAGSQDTTTYVCFRICLYIYTCICTCSCSWNKIPTDTAHELCVHIHMCVGCRSKHIGAWGRSLERTRPARLGKEPRGPARSLSRSWSQARLP